MNKILITSIEQDFINSPNKRIQVEIPAPNSLIVEIEKNDYGKIETNVYVLLK